MPRRTRAARICENGRPSALAQASAPPRFSRSREPVRTHPSLLFNFEQSQKRLLRQLHPPDLLHPLLAFLLFFEQFPLARDVAAITFGSNILAQRLNGLARDDLAADGSLNRHFEHLAWDDLAHLLAQRTTPFVRLVTMHDYREGVHDLAVNAKVQFNQRTGAEVQKLIVKRRVAAAHRLQSIVKVEHHL